MKKSRLLSVFLAMAVLVSMFSVATVSAAEPGYVYDFYYEADFNTVYPVTGLSECNVTWEDHAIKIVAENVSEIGDPNFYIDSIVDAEMEAADYPFVAVNLKNLTDCTEFEGHFSTDLHTISGSTVFHFDIDPNMTEFKTYVFDMTKANVESVNRINGPEGISAQEGATNNLVPEMEEGASFWEGTVQRIRLDSAYREGRSGMAVDGDTVYVAWMAFFATEEEAKNFTEPARSAERTPAPTLDPSSLDAKPAGVLLFDTDDDFNDEFWTSQIKSKIDDVYYNEEKKCYEIYVAGGDDPFLEMPIGTFTDLEYMDPVDCSVYKFMQLGVRVDVKAGSKGGQIYYGTDEHPGYGEAQNQSFSYKDTDEIQSVTVDFSRQRNWTGTVGNCRYDMFLTTREDTVVEFYYLAFFTTKEAADAFAAEYAAKGREAFPAAPTKAPTPVPTEAPATAVPP